ncbi:hypothetical protein OKW41_009143 [Paraburkholderia sp. UCT70]|uniref:DUF3331 domain-containing protein n=2 Tax=unclassified Paraburkholderia TaxID=2615204 RepID=UPI003D1CFC37
MLNAEPNTGSDMLSESGSNLTSIVPALPSGPYPSAHRPGQLAQSKSACGTSSPNGMDPWASTLAAIHRFSSPPDPMRTTPDVSGRPRSTGEPFRPLQTGGGDVRPFTVTVVEKLSNYLFVLRWHDATLCNYEEQVWSAYLARASGCCALSGKHINLGDSVYRPRVRGRVIPLNRDAMILASELVKARTGA